MKYFSEISEVCVDEPMDKRDNVDFHFVKINDNDTNNSDGNGSNDETDSSLIRIIHTDSQQFQSDQLKNKNNDDDTGN